MKNRDIPIGFLLAVIIFDVVIIAVILYKTIHPTPKPKPTHQTESGMHYKIIEGKVVNITTDSLTVIWLNNEIEKQEHNSCIFPKKR